MPDPNPNPNSGSASSAPPPNLDPNAGDPSDDHSTPPGDGTPPAGGNTWFQSWIKPDGTLDHTAFDKAPDDLKPLRKDVEKYKTFEEYAKGQRELHSMASRKGIQDPLPANATSQQIEERAAILRKINGSPEKPEGYALARPSEVPENLWNQKAAEEAQQLAFKYGLPPAALKDFVALQARLGLQGVEAQKAADAEWFSGQDKLIRETAQKEGMDFAKANDLAQRAGRRFGVDPTNPVIKNATVFMLLARLGRMMSEDSLVTGDNTGLGLAVKMTDEQADAAARDIMTNKANPDHAAYRNDDGKQNPSRVKEVRDRVNALLLQANRNRPRRGGR